jgi:hypothetical protein
LNICGALSSHPSDLKILLAFNRGEREEGAEEQEPKLLCGLHRTIPDDRVVMPKCKECYTLEKL